MAASSCFRLLLAAAKAPWQKVVAEPGVVRSVTYTTRPKRPGEINGRDYHFISQEEFLVRIAAGEFLESATVHGYLYGTSRPDVDRLCAQGLDVLLVIDYQGAASLRHRGWTHCTFLSCPPHWQPLSDVCDSAIPTMRSVATRLTVAPTEIAQYQHYDYIIVNDDLESATQQLQAIIVADRCRLERLDRRYPIFSELDGWIHERGTSTGRQDDRPRCDR